MNYFIFILNLLLSTKMTNQFTLGYFDRNRLETYEEISSEQNDIDIFGNLSFHFTCEGMPTGFYADMDYNCKIFHVCENSGGGFPVICANNTVFDQKQRICTDEENIDCQHAHEWYYLNELIYSTEIESKTEIIEETDSKVVQEDFNVPVIACAPMILTLVSFVLLFAFQYSFCRMQRVELVKKIKRKKKCTKKTFGVVGRNNLGSISDRSKLASQGS